MAFQTFSKPVDGQDRELLATRHTKHVTGTQRAGAGPRGTGHGGGGGAQPKERACDCNGDRGGIDGSGSRVTEATTTLAFTACRPASGSTRALFVDLFEAFLRDNSYSPTCTGSPPSAYRLQVASLL